MFNTMDIHKELEDLGFTTNEIKIYLALLRIGRSKAGRLAKECSIERTSAYNALKRLISEGIVSYVIESNNRIFNAAHPDKIIDMFKEKEERAALLVPHLKNLRSYEREKENILKFKGYNGIKTVLNDVLKSCKKGGEYLVFSTDNQLSERMPTYAEIYVARKDEKQLRSRMLVREDKRKKGKKMSKFTKIRYIPGKLDSPANVSVYRNKVAVFIWTEIPEAVIIDNKEAAETFRSFFEFMWKQAKP